MLVPAGYGTFKQAWLPGRIRSFSSLPLGLNQSLVYFVPREPENKGAWISHVLLLTTGVGALAAALLLGLGPQISAGLSHPELFGS